MRKFAVAKEDRRPAPGLHATILYLRPYLRPPLLAGLARLGVFVSEHTDSTTLAQLDDREPTGLLLVIGEDQPKHALLAAALAKTSSAVMIAIVPPGQSADRYTLTCFVTTDDDELRKYLDVIISIAAQEARARRISSPLSGARAVRDATAKPGDSRRDKHAAPNAHRSAAVSDSEHVTAGLARSIPFRRVPNETTAPR